MNALAIILTTLCFPSVPSWAQIADSSTVQVHFQVPRDWKKVNDSTFVLRDYDKQFNLWSLALSEGHMPWRLAPENVAVTCLWSFGIKDTAHTPVWEFASELKEVRKDKVYSLTFDSHNYVVFVRLKVYHVHFIDGQERERTEKLYVPIPYRFEVRHGSKNSG